MPVTIGNKPEADFTEPLRLLSDCHRRIERFLGVLAAVAHEARDISLNPDERLALTTSLRYFKQAAPKHTLDEEDSLFPRLVASKDRRARSVFGSLRELCTGHDVAEALHAQVETLVERWLSDGSLCSDDRDRLKETLTALAEFYQGHIAIEERQIFPLAAVALTAAEIQAIGSEMAERRGVVLETRSSVTQE